MTVSLYTNAKIIQYGCRAAPCKTMKMTVRDTLLYMTHTKALSPTVSGYIRGVLLYMYCTHLLQMNSDPVGGSKPFVAFYISHSIFQVPKPLGEVHLEQVT